MAHWWSVADRCRPRLIDGNATFTTDTSRITITWAVIIRPKVLHGRRGSSAAGDAGWWACGPVGREGRGWAGGAGSTAGWGDIWVLLESTVVVGRHGRRARDRSRRWNRRDSTRDPSGPV